VTPPGAYDPDDVVLAAPIAQAAAQAASRRDQTFPKLAPDQIKGLLRRGETRGLAGGEVLFKHGAVDLPLYIVIEGEIEIIALAASGIETSVVIHEAGEFIGDVDLLAGRPAVVGARARGSATLLEIDRTTLHSLVQTDPELSETMLRAFILRRVQLIARGMSSLAVVGSRHCATTIRIQEFLTRNGRPYGFLDVDRDAAVQDVLDRLQVGVDDMPIVICGGKSVLKHPTIEEVAEHCGLNRINSDTVRDVVIVGAGPGGLAAAVYAASEGLDALVIEAHAPGGQAGTSSKIENYLGFPTGISGQALAGRAFVQAEKFGAEVSVARTALRFDCKEAPFKIDLGHDRVVQSRAVVIASGVQYRKPEVPGLEHFESAGVYFAATAIEATLCKREECAVVGGGNSAGQAAVFLSRSAKKVHMFIRGPGLAETMSRYLIRRIEDTPNIELHTHTQIAEVHGENHLERIVCLEKRSGTHTPMALRHVFVMTGADPNTTWLDGCVALDEKGFIKTGTDLTPEDLVRHGWPLARLPHRFETSIPRVFAVGDVRAGSTKRVASAVGEGAGCISLVHAVLAE
jgi:thioredoxin reductase (NADPH)